MSSRNGPKEASSAEDDSVEMMPKLGGSGISAWAAVAPRVAASARPAAVAVMVFSILDSPIADADACGCVRRWRARARPWRGAARRLPAWTRAEIGRAHV